MRITLNNRRIPLDGTSMQCKTDWRQQYYRLCNDSACLKLLETEKMAEIQCTQTLSLVVVRRAAITAAVGRRHRVPGTNTLLLGSGAMVMYGSRWFGRVL